MTYYNLATYNATTNLFRWGFYETDCDQSSYIHYPEDVVRAWFKENTPAQSPDAEYEKDPCEYWVNHLYMISDIDDLYAYAKEHGYSWERNLTIAGEVYTLEEMRKIFREEICIGDPYGQKDDNTAFWDWIESLYRLHVISDDIVQISYNKPKEEQKPMEKKISKNSIPLLTEAVIEIVDVIDCERPCFRESFDDSRDFNYTISLWAEEFLDWWDEEKSKSKIELYYLDEIRDFTLRKIREKETNSYRVHFSMSGYVDVRATSDEEARELARRQEIIWNDQNVNIIGVSEEVEED